MDFNSLQNIFLNGTDLTTTKNKYLISEGGLIHSQDVLDSPKRKSSFSKFENFHKKICGHATSTKNKILKNAALPKKKHRLKRALRSNRYRDLEDCEDADFECTRVLCDDACDSQITNMAYAGELLTVANETIFGGVHVEPLMNAVSIFPADGQAPHQPQLQFQSKSQERSALFEAPPPPQTLHLQKHLFSAPGMPNRQNETLCFGSAACSPSGFSFRKLKASLPVAAKEIIKMPEYAFGNDNVFIKKKTDMFENKYGTLEIDRVNNMKAKKFQLLNAVSIALVCSPNLRNVDDPYLVFLRKSAENVASFDPEFILKVALYGRQELHIRSVPNYLLSFAAYSENIRAYLEKYFESIIRLPSDWIEVAEMYQLYEDSRLKKRSLPAALKRVMKKCFEKFDDYQLAKYNKHKKPTKKKIGNTNESEELMIENTTSRFTLKQLIRLLHIHSPAKSVMSLLGKIYPQSSEEFKKTGLPGVWDLKLAGTRMKLAIPETWETQISAKGNVSFVWENLIDNSKLPYMAMLRNVRNLILSGISQKHHDNVLKQLQNKIAVINSRQLPTQFYEAYKVVSEIEDLMGSDLTSSAQDALWKQAHIRKMKKGLNNVTVSLLNSYKSAINGALEISLLNNLPPIPGRSLIICYVSFPEDQRLKLSQALKLCFMMGMLCLQACEDSVMKFVVNDYVGSVTFSENDKFMDVLMGICSKTETECANLKAPFPKHALAKLLEEYLKPHKVMKHKLDHVIFLQSYGTENVTNQNKVMNSFLHKYRETVNKKMLYTDVNFSLKIKSFTEIESDSRNVYLCGNSPQLIRYIAERSSSGQLTFVENIDSKYSLQTIKPNKFKKSVTHAHDCIKKIPLYSRVPKWRTIRIFISSTFKDMHSERDLIIRYVIPELRKRAASIFFKINEIDLRWGISEADCSTKRAAELCLLEAQNSDLFIGILGERYGTLYNFEPSTHEDLQWVNDYPAGLSITELEIHAGVLRKGKLMENKAFFYFRDPSFIEKMPQDFASHFKHENDDSKRKLSNLKTLVIESGFKVFNRYPCQFAGIFKKEPILNELKEFGVTVLKDLWNSISSLHQQKTSIDFVFEEDLYQSNMMQPFNYFVGEKNPSITALINELNTESGLHLVTGPPGSGKTSLMIHLLSKLNNFSIIKFFIGLTPRSTDIGYMLQYISNSINREFPVTSAFPIHSKEIINQFPDILKDAISFCEQNKFLLIIDGLDHLESEDQLLDWLPLKIPEGLRILCTASDSSYSFKILCQRQIHGYKMHVHYLPSVQQSERECLVKYYLKQFGKNLGSGSFNNQMLMLITKRESGIPLFLRMACDFLRTYASFDNFNPLLQSLPSTIGSLFQEIILQLENEYGSTLVQTVLTLLCISKEGLDDKDLHMLISFAAGNTKPFDYKTVVQELRMFHPEKLLSQICYCSIINLISTFAFGCNVINRRTLNGSEFEKAVMKFYVNKNYSKFSKDMHCLLAAFYYTLCDPDDDGSWNGSCQSAFIGMMHHLFASNSYLQLADHLCSLAFLEAVFYVEASDFLLMYYPLLLDENILKRDISMKDLLNTLKLYYNFVSRNLHILLVYPNLVRQQALNELKFDVQHVKAGLIEQLSSITPDHRIITIGGFLKNITSSLCKSSNNLAVLGSEDGHLKIMDIASRRIIRSIKSHSSSITSVCFAGKNRICTASTDTTICIFNSETFNRIFTLKGHRSVVSGCCADFTGTILLSSGWDNSVRLWSINDGRSISIIDTFKCSVNCVAHHPMKQQCVCGLWNGTIEVWDTVSLRNIHTLKSYSGSAKSIAYSSDGLNIIASFINASIIIWSSEQGFKLSSLNGHTLPAISLSYLNVHNSIVSGSDDCTLKVWSRDLGLPINTIHTSKGYPVSILKIISSILLAVVFQNGDIWVINMNSGSIFSKLNVVANDIVTCVSEFHCMPVNVNEEKQKLDEKLLVLGTQQGSVMIGDCLSKTIKVIHSFNSRITCMVHEESLIFCGNEYGTIGVLSYPDILSGFSTDGHEGAVVAINPFSKDKNYCAISAANDKTIKVWQIDEWLNIKLLKLYDTKHADYVTSCCWFSQAEEEGVLTGSHDNNIILQGESLYKVYRGLKTSVMHVDYNEKSILGCGSDGSVGMWSVAGTLLSYIEGIQQSSLLLSFSINKDCSNEFDLTLAFVDKDGSIKIQKPMQTSCCYSLEGHSKEITSCSTTYDGTILSCSADGTISLWRVPNDSSVKTTQHSGFITNVMFNPSGSISVSTDNNGKVVLWKCCFLKDNLSIDYATETIYPGGVIKAISWRDDETFVCAITQKIERTENHFIDIYSIENADEAVDSSYNLKVKYSYYFMNEILFLDSNSKTETIALGFKSGDIVLIATDSKQTIKSDVDWILCGKLFGDKSSETLIVSLLSGQLKKFNVSDLMNKNDSTSFVLFQSADPTDSKPFISTIAYGNENSVICGDSQGWLRICSANSTFVSKKVHDDSITGISLIGSYIFTCSLDKTLKGWEVSNLFQVCQFNSIVPITCLAVRKENLFASIDIMIGTTSGSVNLLKFHAK